MSNSQYNEVAHALATDDMDIDADWADYLAEMEAELEAEAKERKKKIDELRAGPGTGHQGRLA